MIRFASLVMMASLASAADPIRLHPDNPHYFEFRGKPTVLITSGEHYGAVLNLDFDYKRYLKTLAADRLNMTRVFTGAYREGPESFGIAANTLAPAHNRFIAPWPRTDVPGAFDGLTRFDLSRWNDAYFARLRDFMKEAAAHGIVVELALFCPFYRDEMWNLSPLNAVNNVNGIGNYKREQVYTLKDPEMQRVQDALVKKIVAELRSFDNLMYEISNEPYAHNLITPEWERHIAGVIAEAEAAFPARQKHLITQNIANGSRKVPDPNPRVSVFNFHYSRPPQSVGMNWDLKRPIGCNETGFDGQADATYRVQAWEFILAGGALFNNLDYSFSPDREDGTYSYPAGQPGGGSVALRKQYRVLRDFMDSIDFIRMSPKSDFVKQVRAGVGSEASAWALGSAGKAYAVYLHHGAQRKEKPRYFVDATPRTAQLTIDLPAGDYSIQWVDPKSGKATGSERIAHKGGTRDIASPEYTEDIALRMKAR
jgi:hypothetical protein